MKAPSGDELTRLTQTLARRIGRYLEAVQGLKVFTLQTLPACDEPFDDGVGKVAGFSLLKTPYRDGTTHVIL